MRSRGRVLSIAIGVVVLAAMWARAWATLPAKNGRAFSTDGAGDRDIWTVNPEGSGLANLTHGPGAIGRQQGE